MRWLGSRAAGAGALVLVLGLPAAAAARPPPLTSHSSRMAGTVVAARSVAGVLAGVTAVSARDAWAVGSTGARGRSVLIMHWNGKAWSVAGRSLGDNRAGV